MLKYAICAAALSLGATSTFAEAAKPNTAAKLTTTECEALWRKALGGQTGELAADKALPYTTDLKKVDTNADGKVQSTEWMMGCDAGHIKVADAATPAGSKTAPTSDRTPDGATDRTPGASATGAAGTDAAKTPAGTSDRTPTK